MEPGDTPFENMIASIEDGILLETNNSWSIDDYRNKFQFGCEKGTLIKEGQLKGVVKNSNYRGITKEFWHNLSMVGDQSSFSILGTANCGKGEPNQTIFVVTQHLLVYLKTSMYLVVNNERIFRKYYK